MNPSADATRMLDNPEALASEFRNASLPAFVDAFEEASERRLRVLYDLVADRLCQEFGELQGAGEGQLEVLARVAEFIGLGQLDLTKPLPSERDEAFAQRVAWRTAARWSVLSLMWALVNWSLLEIRSDSMTADEWASLASNGTARKPRGGSSLPANDEPRALVAAAESLIASPELLDGSGLFLLGLPLNVQSTPDGRVAAYVVDPLALTADDHVWPATALSRAHVAHRAAAAGYKSTDADAEVLTIPSPEMLSADDPEVHEVAVGQGVSLLFKGQPFEYRA